METQSKYTTIGCVSTMIRLRYVSAYGPMAYRCRLSGSSKMTDIAVLLSSGLRWIASVIWLLWAA